MKSILKILGIILLVLVVFIASAITYIKNFLPDVGDPEDIQVEITDERVERGKYLANSVAVCMDCHSTRDWSKYSGPLKEGTLGIGGEYFGQEFGFPGKYYSKNITPFGIKRYTDGELLRVITTGVNKDGRAMFPVMPYPYYGKMDTEDIKSIIAYIRTLEPIESLVPESVSDFPMSIIINTIPQKADPQTRPNVSNSVEYGSYLVNAAACIECHTQAEKGQIIPELKLAGGRDFQFPTGAVVRSANLTPHETGIGKWEKETFIRRFKIYTDSSYVNPSVKPDEFNSIMPWMMYATMSEQDLGAIYDYLKSNKPIENTVVKWTPAP